MSERVLLDESSQNTYSQNIYWAPTICHALCDMLMIQ